MKRLLSIVLALTVTFGCFGVFAADSEAVSNAAPMEGTVDYEEIKNEFTLLKAVGIVGTDEEHTLEDRVTRGEFAILAARIFGDNMQAEAKQYYTDVAENMDCYGSVATLYRLGLISMNSSRTFEPNRNIEYNEACKILVGLLGFSSVADFNGGYPYGYLAVAKKCGILNDVETNANYKNIIKMIYNTLNTVEFEVVAVEVNGDELEARRAQMDSTPLTVYHNVYKIKDTVKTTVIGSTLDSSYCEEDEVRIGNRLFKKDSRNYDELLGLEVTAYYKNVSGQDRTIICSFADDIEEIEIVVRSTTDAQYKNGVLKYYDAKGKEKKITIAKTAPVIRNFDIIGTNKADAYNIDYGKIVVRTQDSISKQNVTIMDCETFIVDYTDSLSKTVYGKYNVKVDPITSVKTKDELNLNEEEVRSVRILNAEDGENEVFARIVAGSVLSVYRNAAEDVVRVYIGTGRKEGKIDSIKNNRNKTIVIDGEEFDVNPQVAAELNARIGMVGIFLMDMFGNVSYYIPGADAWRVGYLYRAGVEEKAFSKELQVMIFDTDSNHNTYTADKKVVLNGTRETDADVVMAKLNESGDRSTYKQLIRFKVTDDGVLTHIDTATKDKNDLKTEPGSLYNSVPYTGTETIYVTNGGFFKNEPLMDRNTIVFAVPQEGDNTGNARRFAIKDKSYFTQQSGNHISAYEVNPEYPYAAYIVARTTSTEKVDVDKTNMFMVDEIVKVMNEEGEVVTRIDGYEKFAAKSIYVENPVTMSNLASFNTDMLKRGDVIRPALDVDGYILDCHIVVDYDKATFNTTSNHIYKNTNDGTKSYEYKLDTSVAQFNAVYAYVVDKYVNIDSGYTDNVSTIPNDVLYLGWTDKNTSNEKWEIRTDKFIVYDSATDEIYVGNSQDVISFRGTDKGSMLLLWKSWGTGAMQIIYR